jgi:hypothetical protein
MIIENRVYRVRPCSGASWLERLSEPFAAALGPGMYPLRLSIVNVEQAEVVLEATVVRYDAHQRYASTFPTIELLHPRRRVAAAPSSPFVAVQIIPTGVRCELGGFAGDAGPATNLLASAVDHLVTHPNAVNASDLNEMAANVLYVEGKSLDDFLLGHLGLAPVAGNRIGTFVDPTGLAHLEDVINALNAAQAVAGIRCELYTVLHEELGVRIAWSQSGCAVGTVVRPEAILKAVEALVAEGVDAVGGVSVIHGVTGEMFAKHVAGEIPNPSGGVEAIITHLISKVFRIPTAHAPLPYYRDMKGTPTHNPRASAEFISTPHYFSVLKGLARAPRLVQLAPGQGPPPGVLTLDNVGAVVIPASCLGGVPALAAEYSGIPVIAVAENGTVLRMTNQAMRMRNVIEVSTYLEAAGALLALRGGLSIDSLRRPLRAARLVEAPPTEAATLRDDSRPALQ